ncbi:MAG TPA: tetraacyldisaccharide 4'-kinase, partial [Anaeromyxobacteraceae bacterium]
VAERLAARGRRVAVLSRGYGANRRDSRVVSDGRRVLLDAAQAGDEPFLLARRMPEVAVLCGPRRAALARRAVDELGADVLVLDDGFQHRALGRDLDVVVVDAAAPCGNGRLLPGGPNREPWAALRRAQLGWISRCDQVPAAALLDLRRRLRMVTGRPPVASRHAVEDVLDGTLRTSLGAGVLRGRRLLLLCALARPGGFRRTLAGLGAEVVAERVFRDHHRFTAAELEEALDAAARAGCDAVATTEKDAVRLPPSLAAHPLLRVVRIRAELVEGAEVLDELLDQVLASTSTSTSTSTPTPTPTP